MVIIEAWSGTKMREKQLISILRNESKDIQISIRERLPWNDDYEFSRKLVLNTGISASSVRFHGKQRIEDSIKQDIEN